MTPHSVSALEPQLKKAYLKYDFSLVVTIQIQGFFELLAYVRDYTP